MESKKINGTNKKQVMNNFDLMFLIWSVLRPVLIVVVCLMLVAAFVYTGVDFVLNRFWLPVDKDDNTPVQVVIERGTSLGKIADTLEAYDLVRSSTVFEYYTEFSGYVSKLKAGTYVFNRQMTMEEIMKKIAEGDGRSVVTTFILIEGFTIEEMAVSLVNQGMLTDKEDFLSLAKDGKEFLSYTFIAALDEEEIAQRKYALEGYLSPDKYEIYVGSSAEAIMKRMLNQFENIMNEKYLSRADELGLTIDEVVTLASIIEREAKPADFSKVSAVFHNRLDRDMALASCATIQYATGTKRLHLTAEDIAFESPFNTYKYKGLPIGPISAPSKKAIEAALYPDEEYMSEGYLFFATKDPESGELGFSKTAEEHQKVVDQYSPLWDAADEAAGY